MKLLSLNLNAKPDLPRHLHKAKGKDLIMLINNQCLNTSIHNIHHKIMDLE